MGMQYTGNDQNAPQRETYNQPNPDERAWAERAGAGDGQQTDNEMLLKLRNQVNSLQRQIRNLTRGGLKVPDELQKTLETIRTAQERAGAAQRETDEAQKMADMTAAERADYLQQQLKTEREKGRNGGQASGQQQGNQRAPEGQGQQQSDDRYSQEVLEDLSDFFDTDIGPRIDRLARLAEVPLDEREMDAVRNFALRGSRDGSYKGVAITAAGEVVWDAFMDEHVTRFIEERKAAKNDNGRQLGAQGNQQGQQRQPANGSSAASAGRSLGDGARGAPSGNAHRPNIMDPNVTFEQIWDHGNNQRIAAGMRKR